MCFPNWVSPRWRKNVSGFPFEFLNDSLIVDMLISSTQPGSSKLSSGLETASRAPKFPFYFIRICFCIKIEIWGCTFCWNWLCRWWDTHLQQFGPPIVNNENIVRALKNHSMLPNLILCIFHLGKCSRITYHFWLEVTLLLKRYPFTKQLDPQ